MSKLIDIGLNFRIWVDDPKNKGAMYNSPPSFWAHEGMHICGSKDQAYQFEAEYKVGKHNVLIAACKQCSDYIIWIEANVNDLQQNNTIKCDLCNRFYQHVVLEDIEYYFCQGCYKSGPTMCKEDQLYLIYNKNIICKTCKINCIMRTMSNTEYYFCSKCEKYKGTNKSTKESWCNYIWSYLSAFIYRLQ
jgi:hypothetical protein